jgi:hypothetical protein
MRERGFKPLETCGKMRERGFKPLETCGPKNARKLIEKARDALGRKAR